MADFPIAGQEEDRSAGEMRIYLGAAPGVGKTYRMLEDAHAMKARGLDVVVGFLDSRGRKDTAAKIENLEQIPRRSITYHNVTLEEMDLEAILDRRPEVCIVDDLAHANVPGSRNRKRYEDVLDLLDAGIDVLTAVNIEHIETLHDSVSRAGTPVRETIPDSLLKRAEEIVNVDITVKALRARLEQGKVFPPEKVEQALTNFFRRGNLNMLRELALRTTAEEVGSRGAEYRRRQGLEQAPIPEKVMVCMSPRMGTDRLLRTGARIAGRLATNWYAVYVLPPGKEQENLAPVETERMQEYERMARDLGARVVVLREKKVADALIEFAQRENISHVVFGQSARTRFDILLRGSVLNRFLSEAGDATVQVVPLRKKEPLKPSR